MADIDKIARVVWAARQSFARATAPELMDDFPDFDATTEHARDECRLIAASMIALLEGSDAFTTEYAKLLDRVLNEEVGVTSRFEDEVASLMQRRLEWKRKVGLR